MQQQLQPNILLQGGKYKIISVLGQGSFGITYLAEHTSLNRKVAIKEFFMKELNSRGEDGSVTGMTDGSLSYNYGQKFIKEAINLSRLDHPNIVRVTDSFQENGTYYYVMDYIEGTNLNDYVKNHTLSEVEAVSIIKDVSDALIYMHEQKHMLHLDLKPGNVMRRSEDGHIFLIDFGLSKHFSDDGQPETSTTIGLGTAGYAPIEQGDKAKKGELRPTIDVYALGATFYKLLIGKTPPSASEIVSDDEIIVNCMKEKSISQYLIDVVVKAMLPSVKKRIQDVRSFKEMLLQNDGLEHTLNSQVSTSDIPIDEPENEDNSEETQLYDKNTSEVIDEENQSDDKTDEPKIEVRQNNPWLKIIIGIIVAIVVALCVYFNKSASQSNVLPVEPNCIIKYAHEIKVTGIELRDDCTLIHKKCIPTANYTISVCSSRNEYIEDANTGMKYYLIESSIGLGEDNKTLLQPGEPIEFIETYPSVSGVKSLNISEGYVYFLENVDISE